MLTIKSLFSSHLKNYPIERNLNYFWTFGFVLSCFLIMQFITGIFLSCYYTATPSQALQSIYFILTEVSGGWAVQRLHVWGAHTIFMLLYLHMFSSVYYGLYSWENRMSWWSGYLLFMLIMAMAFLGYILPWGQMSFWAATVIINMFSTIPFCGNWVTTFLWGGVSVSQFTLQRFFILHIILSFVLLSLMLAHLGFIHLKGSSVEMLQSPQPMFNFTIWQLNFYKQKKYDILSNNNKQLLFKPTDTVFTKLYPTFMMKDWLIFCIFFTIMWFFIIMSPELLSNPVNWIKAQPCQTPTHIIPEWYFLPLYGILKAMPSKGLGITVMVMFLSIPVFAPLLTYKNRYLN